METLIALLSDLVRIESINPDLTSTGSGEAAVAAYVADWLRRAGIDTVVEDVRDGRPNVVARVPGSGAADAR